MPEKRDRWGWRDPTPKELAEMLKGKILKGLKPLFQTKNKPEMDIKTCQEVVDLLEDIQFMGRHGYDDYGCPSCGEEKEHSNDCVLNNMLLRLRGHISPALLETEKDIRQARLTGTSREFKILLVGRCETVARKLFPGDTKHENKYIIWPTIRKIKPILVNYDFMLRYHPQKHGHMIVHKNNSYTSRANQDFSYKEPSFGAY